MYCWAAFRPKTLVQLLRAIRDHAAREDVTPETIQPPSASGWHSNVPETARPTQRN